VHDARDAVLGDDRLDGTGLSQVGGHEAESGRRVEVEDLAEAVPERRHVGRHGPDAGERQVAHRPRSDAAFATGDQHGLARDVTSAKAQDFEHDNNILLIG